MDDKLIKSSQQIIKLKRYSPYNNLILHNFYIKIHYYNFAKLRFTQSSGYLYIILNY